MEEKMQTNALIISHLAAGLLMAAVSPAIGTASYALGAGLLVAYMMGRASERIFGRKNFSWWFGNGLIIYMFAWIDAWTIMINFAGF